MESADDPGGSPRWQWPREPLGRLAVAAALGARRLASPRRR